MKGMSFEKISLFAAFEGASDDERNRDSKRENGESPFSLPPHITRLTGNRHAEATSGGTKPGFF